MKELKFRQPIFSGEDLKFIGFHYWGIIDSRFVGPREWNWEQPPFGNNDINIAQYPEKSQQFTGLRDNTDKEIYEGDIVSWTSDEGSDGYSDIIHGHYETFWCDIDGMWKFRDIPSGDLWNMYEVKFEKIIGNIYENPDLCPKPENPEEIK